MEENPDVAFYFPTGLLILNVEMQNGGRYLMHNLNNLCGPGVLLGRLGW